jgi:hypothetical protein
MAPQHNPSEDYPAKLTGGLTLTKDEAWRGRGLMLTVPLMAVGRTVGTGRVKVRAFSVA